MDSPFANAAYAKEIGVKFPLLSDMDHKVLVAYDILRTYDFGNGSAPELAERTTFVIDKEGKIQHIQQGDSAVDPANAVEVCTGLHKKHAGN